MRRSAIDQRLSLLHVYFRYFSRGLHDVLSEWNHNSSRAVASSWQSWKQVFHARTEIDEERKWSSPSQIETRTHIEAFVARFCGNRSTELSVSLRKQAVVFVIVDASYRVADIAINVALLAPLAFVFLAPGRNSIVILTMNNLSWITKPTLLVIRIIHVLVNNVDCTELSRKTVSPRAYTFLPRLDSLRDKSRGWLYISRQS